MKTVEVEIRGKTSLLVHRFDESAEQQKSTRRIQLPDVTPREAAERVVYRDGSQFYFPSTWISGTITDAGSNHKTKGSRKSLRFVVPSAVFPTDDRITILNGDGPAQDFEVDSRPVTIPATKGRVMRHRPRFDQWGARFSLRIDDDIIPVGVVHDLLNEAGTVSGIGDFRPGKRGPFGTFRVVLWQEATEG